MKFSRIDKMFVDRDKVSSEEAQSRRSKFEVAILCGSDVGGSRCLQLAVLTAAAIADRCFPGAVRVAIPPDVADAPCLAWAGMEQSFGDALRESASARLVSIVDVEPTTHCLVFGDADAADHGLRVTFDGWIARVGPVGSLVRSQERPHNPLSAVLAAALAVSELFLGFAEITMEAGRRIVMLSLWRPDLADDDPLALGPVVEFLPASAWILGLGHLGNAYLWALGALPYADPKAMEFGLFDFDRVELENYETGLIFRVDDEQRLKTRVCNEWLERRHFRTRLVERRFDETFRIQKEEPLIALCGFDSNAARQQLPSAKFARVFESGLGGTSANFDTIGLHTLPNARVVAELWPVPPPEELAVQTAEAERQARANPGYRDLAADDCGRALLAGKAVAVPFVGVTAATLVVSEVLRLLHEGVRFTDGKLRVGDIQARSFRPNGSYEVADLVGIANTRAQT
jgi:hypothetical protein